MRVLNVISDTNIGGAGTVLINYLRYRDAEKFETAVLLPRGSMLVPKIEPFGVKIYEVDGLRDRSFSPLDIGIVRDVIKDFKPDVVHTHGALSGRIAAKRCAVPVVFTRHSAFPLPSKYKKFPLRGIYRFITRRYADRIIIVSPYLAQDLIDVGIDGDMIDPVMNGSEALRMLTNEQRSEVRARYGVGNDEYFLGLIARIEPYKCHTTVLEALAVLKEQGRAPRVIFAGTGTYEAAVRARAKELGVEELVIFPGFVDGVGSLIAALDVQLNASEIEATSLSLIEGMSVGVPAIASDSGGNPYVIQSGENGIVFKTGDAKELADAIDRLRDESERRKLADRAKEIYSEKFTGKAFAENTEKVYLKACKGEMRYGQ